MKKIFNFFGIVLALLLSVVLIPTLIFNPVWRGVSGLLQPAVIEELTLSLVEEIDLAQISLDQPELVQSLTEAGVSPEAAQALLASQTAKDVLAVVGSDLAQVLQGSFTASSLTESEALRIVDANRAELIQIARLMMPSEAASLTDEQLSLGLDSIVQEEILPLLGEINQVFIEMQAELHGELAVFLELATGPMVPTALLVAAVVFALLIFLFRWPQQRGFLWLGIDCALAAMPVLGIAFSLKGAQLSHLLAQGSGLPDVFHPVLQRVASPILTGGIILAAAAIVLIATFILLRDHRMKKAAAAQEYAPTHAVATAPFIAAETQADETEIPAPEETPAQRSPWDNV